MLWLSVTLQVSSAAPDGFEGNAAVKFTQKYWVRLFISPPSAVGTAEHIYEECDGLQYEHCGGKLDLRYDWGGGGLPSHVTSGQTDSFLMT